MEHASIAERVVRGALVVLVVIFFLFPIFWIFLMSFQTNEEILPHSAQSLLHPRLSPTTRR